MASRWMAWVRAAVAGLGVAGSAAAEEPVVKTLANGVRVVVLPMEGVQGVGAQAIYSAGFVDEPAGGTQVAHLIEHLRCMGATAAHGAGASYALLNGKGMVNAETLPTFTHYDYILGPGDGELAAAVEAERLGSLVIDGAIVAQEAPRCYAEVGGVVRIPGSPVAKFAMMAAVQGWMHGKERAMVRSGLEDLPLATLEAFHREQCGPSRLTFIVAGGVEPVAMEVVERTLGGVAVRPSPRPTEIDWSKVAKVSKVRWDGGVGGVFIAFPPPASADERAMLTVWGDAVAERLMADAAGRSSMVSNTGWPVGRLPFFVYTNVPEGRGHAEVADELRAKVAAWVSELGGEAGAARLRMAAAGMKMVVPPAEMINAQGRAAAKRMGKPEELGPALAACQVALRWGMVDAAFDGKVEERRAFLEAIDAATLDRVLREVLDPARGTELHLIAE